MSDQTSAGAPAKPPTELSELQKAFPEVSHSDSAFRSTPALRHEGGMSFGGFPTYPCFLPLAGLPGQRTVKETVGRKRPAITGVS